MIFFLIIASCILTFGATVLHENVSEILTERLLLFSIDSHTLYIQLTHHQVLHAKQPTPYVHVFPLAILQLLNTTSLRSFSGGISQGEWRESLWGQPPVDSVITDPGGFMSLELDDGDDNLFREKWTKIAHGLDGVLCSSFGTIQSSTDYIKIPLNTTSDKVNAVSQPSTKYIDRIPLEALCTENWTPFLKLLPCRSKAGLGYLLRNPKWYARLPYKAISLQATHSTLNEWTLETNLQAIVRIPAKDTWDSMITEQLSNASQEQLLSWLGHTIFDNEPAARFLFCPPINASYIDVVIPNTKFVETMRRWDMLKGDLLPLQISRLSLKSDGKPSFTHYNESVTVPRYLKVKSSVLQSENYSLQTLENTLVWMFSNPSLSLSKKMKYYGVFPHIITPLTHTLNVLLEHEGHDKSLQQHMYLGDEAIKEINFQIEFPKSPDETSQFVMTYVLPPNSQLTVSIKFWKKFLHVGHFNFSPDRGLLFPGGIFQQDFIAEHQQSEFTKLKLLNSFNNEKKESSDYFTSSHYIMFALPDLSMPFNVAAISTTIAMLFFGTVFQMTAGRPLEKNARPPLLAVLRIIIARIQKLIAYVKEKKQK